MKSMRMMIYKICLNLIMVAMLFSTSSWAAQPKDGFEVKPLKTTDRADKSWTIKFNREVNPVTVTGGNIYITDENNILVASSLMLSNDKTSIVVKPADVYAFNKEYRLYISNQVKSTYDGKNLKRAQVMPFKVTASSAEGHVKDIKIEYSQIISNVLVYASDEVFTVKANGKDMHYEGSNSYSLGIQNLEKGSVLVITAYDDNDNILQTYNYKVD